MGILTMLMEMTFVCVCALARLRRLQFVAVYAVYFLRTKRLTSW